MPTNDLSTVHQDDGIGARRVGVVGIVVSLTMVLAFAAFDVYSLLKLWPHNSEEPKPAATTTPAVQQAGAAADVQNRTAPAPNTAGATTQTKVRSGMAALDKGGYLSCAPNDTTNRGLPIATADTARGADCIVWFGKQIPVWIEQRLFVIVLLAGALGATVHALRSMAWYVGNRQLVYSWLAFYLSLPLVGSLLAASFYMIVRGGFFSSTSVQATNTFGFAALGVLIGMFTQPAVLKLKDVAETVLVKPQPGADTAPPQQATADSGTGVPTITSVERKRRSAGDARDALMVSGAGFGAAARVSVNGAARAAEVQSAQSILLPLSEEDTRVIDAGGDFVITIANPGGSISKPHDFA